MINTPVTSDKISQLMVLKLLADCKDGELIRLENGDWTIFSSDGLVIISGVDAPRFTPRATVGEEVCLSYGSGFDVIPNRDSSLVITTTGSNKTFNPKGALIYSRPYNRDSATGRHLAAVVGGSNFKYLDLSDFRVRSEPGGYRAVFNSWRVAMRLPWHNELVTLFTHIPPVQSSGALNG